MVNIKKEKEKRVKIRTHRAFISAPGPGLCTFHPIHPWEQPGVIAKREGP